MSGDLRARLLELSSRWTYGGDPHIGLLERDHAIALAAARVALEDAQHECERMAEGSFVGAVCANRIRALAAGLDNRRER